jgi:dGTPase
MVRTRAQEKLRAMFQFFTQHPEQMPASFQARIPAVGVERSVGDYLAGMTDRFAQREYERIIGT